MDRQGSMTPGELRLDVDGHALIARLSGEIDLSNAEQLGKRIAAATPPESVGVVLDLSDVTYLDSFGVHVIFGLRQVLAERGRALALVVPPDSPALAALQIANVSEGIEITEAVEEALERVAQGSSR
jgi:anti-anti-sigma factor